MAVADIMVRGVRARTRGPVITWLLLVVTLGIYGLFHWYYINREMRDVSAAMGNPFGNAPGMSVLALFPGGILIIPAIWTWVTTARRARARRRARTSARCSRSRSRTTTATPTRSARS